MLLADRDRLAEAEEWLARADQRGHPAAAHNLGLLLEQRGDIARAAAAYGRADDRGDADGAFQLAILLTAQNRLAEAEEALARADQRGHPAAANSLAELRERRHEIDGPQSIRKNAYHNEPGEAVPAAIDDRDRGGQEVADDRGDRDAADDRGKRARVGFLAPMLRARRLPGGWLRVVLVLGVCGIGLAIVIALSSGVFGSQGPTPAADAATKPAHRRHLRRRPQNCGPDESRCRTDSDSRQSTESDRDNRSPSEEGHGLDCA